jgi:uncharacterized protein YhfF
MYLPEGPKRPKTAELDAFWAGVCEKSPDIAEGADYQVRWIGLDNDSTEQIIDLILARDKTGTFTLPWLIERTAQPDPQVGDLIILIDFDGKPRVAVRLTHIHTVSFGEITAQDIAIDGSPVRALDIWRPLHTQYWNAMLVPFGLAVSDDMPVLVEAFELLDAA